MPTLTAQNNDVCRLQLVGMTDEKMDESRRRVYDPNGLAPTIPTCGGGGQQPKVIVTIDGKPYRLRVRRLTPRECWRLMGFHDEDFDRAEKVNSNSQLYKQAGNSIVVDVLEAIFKEML